MYTIEIKQNDNSRYLWHQHNEDGIIMNGSVGIGHGKKDDCLHTLQAIMGDGRCESLLRGGLRGFTFIDKTHTLLGSDIQPSVLYTKNGNKIPLGDVVARAQTGSGINMYDWNKLSSIAMEYHIEQEVIKWGLSAEKPEAPEEA